MHVNGPVIPTYLDLLDSQREATFTVLEGLTPEQIWQRPAPKEWCIGEILNHAYLLNASAFPYVRFAWKTLRWYGERKRSRLYQNAMADRYRDGKFPMWTGFLWTPRHKPSRPVSLDVLQQELRTLHGDIRAFYRGKDEDVLGNISIYDPYFGYLNLILTLRLGIYHDALHFEDVEKYVQQMKS